ncbi:MAG TPA: thymidine kinase, partial [Bdellovibrionales bacterium]|nr:thymidine kinase [Bdellovibrionales bacterium]
MNDGFVRPAPQGGWVEVIVGCMFSGKTEELIKQVRRAHIAKQRTQTFKPQIDSRYSAEDVASHDQNRLTAFRVTHAHEIPALIHPSTKIVAIDEGQFFGDELVEIASVLADRGVRVIIAGLDTDWRGRPFGPMPQLLAV